MENYDELSRVLLTGTPVQNDLGEMYALLSFVSPDKFALSKKDDFLQAYKHVKTDSKVSDKLQQTIKAYIVRRTKAEVALDIPDKSELSVYHPISELQKKYYKAILTKDADAFETGNTISKTKLLNILMQLRKCVNHPYLFDGVEPEPFQLGEHLVEASTKLIVLDRILQYLAKHGHKVLIFSQMTRMLDILQDYLHYRGYTYERLDGSMRGEERFVAIKNFNSTKQTFVFLLSSRAGGQGLTLTAADTVIFYDHDFNPQVDLQAAARAHRIGQTRPVKIIRLVAKSTVEEVILARAQEKLRLTRAVMTADKDLEDDPSNQTSKDLQNMLKHGLTSLLSPDTRDDELNIRELLGESKNSRWVIERFRAEDGQKFSSQQIETIYQFEGKDYSKEAAASTSADNEAFEKLIAEVKIEDSEEVTGKRRRRVPNSALSSLSLADHRTRKPLTPAQLEARKKNREATLKKQQEQAELRAKKKEEQKLQKWLAAGYNSRSVTLPSESEATDTDEDDVDYMHFVSGDVTQPVDSKVVVVQCVDDSGQWGIGGVFTAMSDQTKEPELYYDIAGNMGDLHEGDVHVVDCNNVSGYDEYSVALMVAQDRKLRVKQGLLATCLKKLAQASKDLGGRSVHLPRIGYSSPGFDWYSTERQLRKYLSKRKIHTYIYYYRRRKRPVSPLISTVKSGYSSDVGSSPSGNETNASNQSIAEKPGVFEDLFTDINFFIDAALEPTERKKLKRYIIAFDGNIETTETERTNFVVTAGARNAAPSAKCILIEPNFVFDCICGGRPLCA
ncbi:chromodomain-helicase-DNA-binding protein 1-like isoform X2 [Watersipora subatra]